MCKKPLTGEIAIIDGRGQFSVPASGLLGSAAIQFRVIDEHEASSKSPAWTDIEMFDSDGKTQAIRINPEIVKSPFFRLCDCLLLAWGNRQQIAALEPNKAMQKKVGKNVDEPFIFFPVPFADKAKGCLIMIDTGERFAKNQVA